MTKSDHEIAVDEYVLADAAYKKMQTEFLDGTITLRLVQEDLPDERIVSEWQAAVTQLRALLEDRNAKAKAASGALRQAVTLAPSQWRGPDGKPTKTAYGPLEVSSVTGRSFDAEALISHCQKKGILERLLQLRYTKTDGREVNSVYQEWVIDYESTLKWLRQNKFEDIVQAAYDEKEKTPAVTGAKPMAFLGEVLKG